MKFLAIFLILVSILSFSNAFKIQHTNARVYCGNTCSGPYSDVSININQCTILSEELTCGYALPYLTASLRTSSPSYSYSVSASFACGRAEALFQDVVTVGQCNTYTVSDVQFSILADPPTEGEASSSNSLKPIALFSTLLILIISLIL
ncbi:hypothetical protein RB653_008939 [Dictyostelium firmibasis]|uniref:Uncharacterized protein n=1 Tax=Dictyostelium firmibasis TaxID=79012 RepID=A0AAN7UDF9_9MYCE